MNIWFFSDLHLKSDLDPKALGFVSFLEKIMRSPQSPTHIFLLGDIFDMWIGPSQAFCEKYQTIVHTLLKIQKSGTQITFFEGNHDFHMKNFWKRHQIQVVEDILYWSFEDSNRNSHTARLEHGDLINLNEVTYLRYRKLIRSLPIKLLANILPGQWINEIGIFFSQKSRNRSSDLRKNKAGQFREMIRKHAVRTYHERSFDLIVSGHMHIFDDWSFNPTGNKEIRSINLGSWFEQPWIALNWKPECNEIVVVRQDDL